MVIPRCVSVTTTAAGRLAIMGNGAGVTGFVQCGDQGGAFGVAFDAYLTLFQVYVDFFHTSDGPERVGNVSHTVAAGHFLHVQLDRTHGCCSYIGGTAGSFNPDMVTRSMVQTRSLPELSRVGFISM